MAELCRIYEISRESGYKWMHRSEANESLEERSRAPVRHPNQTERSIEEQLLALRRQRWSWAARKLLFRLEQKHPNVAWPVANMVGTC